MYHIFSVSWCQNHLVCCQNFWVFCMPIFEKLQFYTYMDNMHIKWKLKSFWIHICYQKVLMGMKTFWKKNNFKIFYFDFQGKKIWMKIFSDFLFQYPQNFILDWFTTPKKKFTWRIDNPYFIIEKMVSSQKCFGHFVPPLSLIRVNIAFS